MKSKDWHSRGYLPHFDGRGVIQAITFRLHDSLPQKVVQKWKTELSSLPESEARIQLHQKITHYEDAGHGSCLLKKTEFTTLVQDAFLHFDGERYHLLQWVIMPNHIHLLIETKEESLDRIIKSWKTFTARQINLAQGSEGPVWARDYHDRYIRDLDHYENAKSYLRQNPVKAGLCETPEDWPYSSAHLL